jgi:hypothetical protein
MADVASAIHVDVYKYALKSAKKNDARSARKIKISPIYLMKRTTQHAGKVLVLQFEPDNI